MHATVLFLVGWAALLAGCAQPPLPQDQFYRLQLASPTPLGGAPRLDGVLEVGRLTADGLTAGRNIVFVEAKPSHALAAYHYHLWIEPPTIMLRDQMIRYLRTAGVANTVVTREMRADPDFVVIGRIHRLERVLGTKPAAVVELELGVRRIADGRLVLLETYRHEAPVEGDSVGDAVAAMNGGLEAILKAFVADLAALSP